LSMDRLSTEDGSLIAHPLLILIPSYLDGIF
jgi:hypothetical protein